MDCRKKKQDGEQTLYDDLQSSNDVARERAYLLTVIKRIREMKSRILFYAIIID